MPPTKSRIKVGLSRIKVTTLTAIIVVSFILSSIGWHHIESVESIRVIVAGFILIIMYILIIFELVNRNLAAIIGACMSIAAYDCLVEFVDLKQIVQWEDLETLSLLFGMMIMVNILGNSGLFNYLAIWSYKKSGGRFWLLIVLISIITALLSAFIDNVSTMLLLAPTLIKLSELEHVDPRYILMIMVMISNIGGCATPVGDPPNLIIINDKLTNSLGISFGSFVAYCLPGVVLIIMVVLIYLRLLYKSKESFRLEKEKLVVVVNVSTIEQCSDETQLVNELKALESSKRELLNVNGSMTSNCMELLIKLDEQIEKHQQVVVDLKRKETLLDINRDMEARRGSRLNEVQINALIVAYAIKSRSILIQSLSVLCICILLFFLQSIPDMNLTLGWVSLFAGFTLLVLSSSSTTSENNTDDDKQQAISKESEESSDGFETTIRDIEWSMLIFFAALFVIMEVMDKLGLVMFVGGQITDLVDLLPSGNIKAIGSITIILWASGLASAFIDNVPFASMMIKVLGSMSSNLSNEDVGEMKPLIFALVFGSCLGGSATLIGASANIVTASVSNRFGYSMTYNSFFKFSAPITAITLFVANIYLVFVFVILEL